jgi:hypothetical protein
MASSPIDFEPIVALGGLDEQNSLYFPRKTVLAALNKRPLFGQAAPYARLNSV